LLRLGQLIHGKGVDKKVTAEQPKEMPKPAKQELLAVVQKFKLNAGDRLVVKPKDEPSVDFLECLGLVKTEVEYSLNPRTGVVEQRKIARWVSWNCGDCVNYFVGDLREKVSLVGGERVLHGVRQCKKGFSLQFTDMKKGKRCAFFEDKRLKGALE
jgi:hypothetical protein